MRGEGVLENQKYQLPNKKFYFRFGVILLCVFIITSLLSYGLGTCKRRKHHLVRINNTVPQSATISTIFGPGGIIQPLVNLKNSPIQQEGETKVTAYIGRCDKKINLSEKIKGCCMHLSYYY